MDQHISEATKKAFYLLRCAAEARNFVDQATCNVQRARTSNFLVRAIVFPHLDYCNSLLVGAPLSTLNCLQRVINAANRLVDGITRMKS